MSRTDARTLINREGRTHTVVVYFTKRDGSLRRMVCRYDGTTSRRPHLITVWDMEKGAYRTVNLDTVSRVTICKVREDRAPVSSRYEAVKQELETLFY